MIRLSILHVVPSLAPRYGGPPRIAECCEALARLEHHVELVSTTLDGRYDLDVPVGVPFERHGFAATAFSVPALRGWAFSPSLAHWLRLNVRRFDVVHVHGVYGFTTLAAAGFCRAQGVPYILQPHGALTAYHRAHHRSRKALYEWTIERRNARLASTLRWESARERDEGVEVGWPAGVVIPSGVWLPGAVREDERRPDEVVFLGRLSRKKGVDALIEAFARVVVADPGVRLRIAGPDQDVRAAELERRAHDLGIASQVVCEGLVEGEVKNDLLRYGTVFVVPSADESFGAVAVEAMAHGAPTIVTKGCPFYADLEHEEAAIVAGRDPASLAAAILRVLGDARLRSRLSTNGQRFVAARFGWDDVARRLEALYGEYATGRSTRRVSAPTPSLERP